MKIGFPCLRIVVDLRERIYLDQITNVIPS